MYKILRSIVEDNGADSDSAIESASMDLAQQVEDAELDACIAS